MERIRHLYRNRTGLKSVFSGAVFMVSCINRFPNFGLKIYVFALQSLSPRSMRIMLRSRGEHGMRINRTQKNLLLGQQGEGGFYGPRPDQRFVSALRGLFATVARSGGPTSGQVQMRGGKSAMSGLLSI